MAQTLSFSPLSLELPSSRMSVDFSTFAPPQLRPVNEGPRTSKPFPQLPQHNTVPRRPVARPRPLPEVKEESEPNRSMSSGEPSRKWPWSRPSTRNTDRSEPPSAPLSRANSSASTISSGSTASTAASSVFSNAQSTSTARTSHSSFQHNNTPKPYREEQYEPLNLSTLPLSLLEHILSYTLCLPLTVSIGPQSSENRHMQYRYHRAGLDYIDIQLILKHPIFVVSQKLREVALDVFYRKCDFVIDLHRIYHTKVSSTINENLRKHQKFWIQEPPKMVRDAFRNLSKLHLRLPVPSCENGGHRDRDEDDWMDGSDGKGGGSWKIRSLKKEQEDAVGVHKCVEAIMELIMANPGSEPEPRGRSSSLSRTGSLRKRSLSRLRSRSRSRSGGRQTSSRSSSRQDGHNTNEKRQLRRMEIVLVKRNPYVMVLPETLSLIKTLRSIPVTGFTKYYFELDAQKVLWATKYRKRWQGFEPDGTRLLNDLQGLTIASKPIEPIRTPTEFKFVNVSKRGKLQLSESAVPRTPIVLERLQPARNSSPASPLGVTPSNASTRRRPLPWNWKKAHKRKDSKDSFALMIDEGMDEIGSSGTTTSGRNNPPSVDELKKIAEDIKNGLY
ncbi:hypothetical protein K458DRAFT_434282 [Lentithecium fluviatile CBS 122367]|uniref:Uncharacterized protein n=1 Tax=Lentithecium fluviatile CBS 122367 TaxID=1168545 RepID=A0A6G1IR43_9PLEO|nr:hypothetical protein K458DRAFT_434282 [Lentithecium fluviatile CBS 122367]